MVLVQPDPVSTTIDFSEPIEVARGTAVSDSDGARQATLFFPAASKARMVLRGGTPKAMTQLTVRATEYTVGEKGPLAMPAELPAGVGYTYCVEFTADEAIKARAKSVEFSPPVINYVENFLHFPVGSVVPTGYYDRELGQWVPSDNGRVVGILGEADGLSELDINGDGAADDAAALEALGVTEAERRKLAELYEPGQSLWRVPIPHFSPWDCNWPYSPPPDAEPPYILPPDNTSPEENECHAEGSEIAIQGQVLRERVSVAGTPFHLTYSSDRVPGRGRRLEVFLTGEEVPAGVQDVRLHLEIAGQVVDREFGPAPNLSDVFVWDGRDGYGRGRHTD